MPSTVIDREFVEERFSRVSIVYSSKENRRKVPIDRIYLMTTMMIVRIDD
jgi:hypothetical protein